MISHQSRFKFFANSPVRWLTAAVSMCMAVCSPLATAESVSGEAVWAQSAVLAKSGTELSWKNASATPRTTAAKFRPLPGARVAAARASNGKATAGRRGKATQVGIVQLAKDDLTSGDTALAWQSVPGGRTATIEVDAATALGLRVGLRLGAVPAGSEFRFAGSTDYGRVVHVESAANLAPQIDADGVYWTPMTEGAAQRIEVFVPGAPASDFLSVHAVSHFFAVPSNEFKDAITPKVNASGACQKDVVCRTATTAYTNAKNATAKMLYQKDGGSYVCTGTLLNDNEPSSQIPYFYSANHCFSTQSAASTLTTYWFYEKPTCNGPFVTESAVATARFGGATLLYADNPSDVLFLRLNTAPPANAFFLGWDSNTLVANTNIAVFHHPQGDPKKHSLGQFVLNQSYTFGNSPGEFAWVGYTDGSTETGSSGSGLLTTATNGDMVLRGGLAGGSADCTNSGNINNTGNRDIYSRFDLAFPKIRQWLFDAATAPATNYTDLWWAGDVENGWGMSVVQHSPSNQQFNALYIYDSQGNPLWVVMPGGTWSNGFTTITGSLYIPSGSFWQNYNTANFRANAAVGSLTINYLTSSTATLSYTINGVSGTKTISRQDISGGTAPFNVADMWYGGAAQDGWGVSILQQTGTPFAIWYTYGSTGTPTWFVMPGGGSWVGNVYTAPLYTTKSSAWIGATYNKNSLVVTAVGSMSFNFTNANAGTMTYTVNGVQQSKSIQRQSF